MNREAILRMLLAMVLAFGLVLLWQSVIAPRIWPPPEPTEPAPQEPSAPAAAESPAEPPPASTAGGPESPAIVSPPAEAPSAEAPVPTLEPRKLTVVGAGADEADAACVLGSAKYESAFDLEAEVQARGATVRRLALSRRRFFKTVADRGEKDPDKRAAMELVEPTAPFPAFAIPELRVWFAGAEGPAIADLSETPWRLEREACSPTEVVASVEVEADGKPAVRVTKRYTLRPRSEQVVEADEEPQYELGLAIQIEALDKGVERVAYVLQGLPALPREDVRGDLRLAVVGEWTNQGVVVETAAGKSLASPKEGEPLPAKSLAGATIAWVGQVDKYFAAVLIPQQPSPEGTFAAGAEAFRYEVREYGTPVPLAGVRLLTKEQPLAAAGTVENVYTIYAGPKDPKVLEAYAGIGLPELVDWSRCCDQFSWILVPIAKVLGVVLEGFYAVVGNYGLAIMLLVVVLQVLMYPITRSSAKSMIQMQKLAPRMQAIRDQHKDDKEALNAAMAKLYREEGLMKAQLGGCLPMFLQMPIWIALYGLLGSAISLRHAAFLPAWMVPEGSIFLQDLSQPDALIHWLTPWHLPGRGVPLFGAVVGWIETMMTGGSGFTSLNVLPLLVTAAFYFMQKLTPTPAANPQAEQQQKMMQVLFPVMFLLFLYSAPSGLCLYIAVSSTLRSFEQRYLKKKFAAEAVAKAEGRAPPVSPKKSASVVAGRSKSLAERIEAWLQKRLEQGKKGK